MADLLDVKDTTWEQEVLNSETPVLVDFWAPWCGPCKALGPTVEAVAQELTGRVKVVKCDIDQARPIAMKYGVMSIPALLLFKKGKVVEHLLGGNQRREGIISKVEQHL